MQDGRWTIASPGRWTMRANRSRKSFMSVCIVFLCLLVSSALCEETGKGSWADYSIVAQRNIFSRNRRAKVAVSEEVVARTPVVVRTEESYLVLRGVVREKDVFISFIEDSRTGEVKKIRPGEVVGGGTLYAATLDYVTYKLEKADTRVEIGRTLEGKAPETSSSSYSGGGYFQQQSSYDTQQTVQPVEQTVVSDDEAKDILQRLKERRKKELGE